MYMSRSKKMLQMALNVNNQRKRKYSSDESSSIDKNKCVSLQRELLNPIMSDEPTSKPSALLELDKACSSKTMNTRTDNPEVEISFEPHFTGAPPEEIEGELQDEVELNLNSSSGSESIVDDSDADPNFEPPNLNSLPGLLSSEDECNSSIERMAVVLENNLSQMRTQNKIQPRKIRQKKRNYGKSYNTATGKKVEERKMIKLTPCIRKCSDKISEDQQQLIFEEYWALGEYNLRRLYVCGLVSIENKKTQSLVNRGNKQRNREYSYKYHLKVNEHTHQVCQKCFKYTLGETDKFLKTVIKHKINSPGITIDMDRRGKNTPLNKLTPEKIQEVKDHINSFPKYESHYSRNKSAQLYLESDLNITKMYQLYSDNYERHVSLSKYSEIFKTMNIRFKKPKVDTCNTCDKLKMQISLACDDKLKELKMTQEKHHIIADLGYSSKRDDIAAAKTDISKKILIFDLQQVLPTPKLNSNIAYYKRYLSVYNLTIHDGTIGTAHCYMWHDGSAGRGANEIASCLFEHINSLSESYKSLILYSDNCFGQNKNSIVASMMMLMASIKVGIETIDHKFLEVGHTHMECDQDHSIIERRKKNTGIQIQHPREWHQFVRSCSTTKKRFEVNEMDSKMRDFKSFSNEKFVIRKVDNLKNKVNWRQIKWLRFTKNFGKILYKNSLQVDEPFLEINISKRGVSAVKVDDVHRLTGPNLITATKKKDLVDLLALIDPQYHNFYTSLETKNNPIDNKDTDFIEDEEDDSD